MKGQLKYKNITVSGLICAGATTLSRLLAENLRWQRFSVGEFFRDWCEKNNLPLEETLKRPEKLEKQIDSRVKERLEKEENLIIEGKLAGFMAQGIPQVLKVLLLCEDLLRLERLVNRENITLAEAKKKLRQREEENLKAWSKIYGTSDFWNPKYYDLVINTSSHDPTETLNLVLRARETI